jgi:predicted metal-dependent peptidase
MERRAPPGDAARKLAAARTQLVMEKPFLGVLVLHLPLVPADPAWCRTTATDARAIYYNPAYIETLSLEQTKFALAHEALHCALSHFHRREHRVRRRWDVACDFAVNALLVADGLVPTPDALHRRAYEGMAAEEIYPYIGPEDGETPQDQHLYEEGDDGADARGQGARPGPGGPAQRPPRAGAARPALPGAPGSAGTARAGVADTDGRGAPPPRPPASTEREQLATQWRLRLAAAAQQAQRAGKLPGALARAIDDLVQPRLPWRTLLARYLTSAARTDYSFARPGRREGAAILPGLRAAHIELAVVIDTSGSITGEELQEFLSEVSAITSTINARVTLHACDAELAPEGPWVYEPWEELRLPASLTGGGGTRFAPALEWAETLERRPDALLYFTDAEGEFPERAPPFPVLWLVKGPGTVPWGERVQLN